MGNWPSFLNMTDSRIVKAVCSRTDGALGAAYDAYASALYQYSWFLLADDEAAGAVVRDVFIVMDGRIDDLAEPAALRPWLFAIARAECRRRTATGIGSLGERPPRTGEDAGWLVSRAIALAALTELAELDQTMADLLVLHHRFGLEPGEAARVLGLPPDGVPQMLSRAGEHLRDALTAEILTRIGPSGCPRRSEVLAGWGGKLTSELRTQLARHASVCEQCKPSRPRTVAPAKVFEPLPWPELPGTLRTRVMSAVDGPSLAGYRNFVLYRAGIFGKDGFPRTAGVRPQRRRRRARTLACASVAALVIVVAGVAMASHSLDGARHAVGTIRTWANDLTPHLRTKPEAPGLDSPGGRTPVAYPQPLTDDQPGSNGTPGPQSARDQDGRPNGSSPNVTRHRPAPSRESGSPSRRTPPSPNNPPAQDPPSQDAPSQDPTPPDPTPSYPSDPPSSAAPSDPPSSATPGPSPSDTPSDPPAGSASPSP